MRILHLLLADFTTDARVLRAAVLGRDLGAEVRVLALHDRGLARAETVSGVGVERVRLWTRPLPKWKPVQVVKYGEALVRMAARAARWRPDLIHAHDLPALPAGCLAARACGARLVYDAHELWSDPSYAAGYMHGLFRAGFLLERFLARRADAVVTVGEAIAREMARNLRIATPSVIRNLPRLAPEPGGSPPAERLSPGPLRRALGIDAGTPLVLHQGCVHTGRGLPCLVAAMDLLTHSEAVLAILGDGCLVVGLREQAARAGLGGRVLFHRAVAPAELPLWTRDADVGVVATEPVHKSFELSLPNKLFEYIHAGIPVVATDLPETSRVLMEYGVGEIFRAGDARALARAIDGILGDAAKRDRYRAAAMAAAAELNWGREGRKLESLYASLLSLPAARPPAVRVVA